MPWPKGKAHTPEMISKRVEKQTKYRLPELIIVDRLLNTDATTRSLALEFECSDSVIKRIFRKHTTEKQRLDAKNRKHGEKTKGNPFLWKHSNWTGRKHTKEAKEKQSTSHIGKKKNLHERIAQSARIQGVALSDWKEFSSSKIDRLKSSSDYRSWRNSVFLRDDWTCQECGVRGVKLHSHHIKPKSVYPELIFNVENGITLCVECHKSTDTYGVNNLHRNHEKL